MFFEKPVTVNGPQRVVVLLNGIVETISKHMLLNTCVNKQGLTEDHALNVFKPVTVLYSKEVKEVDSYKLMISTLVEFDYVLLLLASELSFSQVLPVIQYYDTVMQPLES